MAQNKILRIIMLCEPIYTVRAIEFAKSERVKSKHYFKEGIKLAVQGGAGAVIGEIAQRLAGEPTPGVSSAVLGHILAPYYAVEGDGAAAGGAAAGMYGCLSGAIIGFVVGGPVGAFIGGAIGGAGLRTGTSALIRAVSHPHQCSKCKGVVFDADYERCTCCDGYGYTKGKR